VTKYLPENCNILSSDPGATASPKGSAHYSKWGFYLAPRYAALSIHTPSACMIERRSADGDKSSPFGSSGNTASGAGVFGSVHPHALGGVHNIPPPPPHINKYT